MKIAVFYHVFLTNDFKFRIQDQLTKVFISGLYDQSDSLFLGVGYERPEDFEWLQKLVSKYDKIQVCGFSDISLREKNTMRILLEFAQKTDAYICYFHSKGVWRQSYISELWRMMMDYHVLYQWEKCVAKLKEGYDTAGVLYREATFLGHWPHYSGTYWWATSSHIRALNHELIQENAGSEILPHAALPQQNAFGHLGAEFWIGSSKRAKHFCFHPFNGIEPANYEFLISEYVQEGV